MSGGVGKRMVTASSTTTRAMRSRATCRATALALIDAGGNGSERRYSYDDMSG